MARYFTYIQARGAILHCLRLEMQLYTEHPKIYTYIYPIHMYINTVPSIQDYAILFDLSAMAEWFYMHTHTNIQKYTST